MPIRVTAMKGPEGKRQFSTKPSVHSGRVLVVFITIMQISWTVPYTIWTALKSTKNLTAV